MKRIVSTVAGVFFIILGIIGLFLPFLQGILFIILGISFLSPKLAAVLRRKFARKVVKLKVITLDEWRDRGVRAGYTTRHFPVHFKRTDDLLVPENQNKFVRSLYDNQVFALSGTKVEKFVVLNQIHSDDFAVLGSPEEFPTAGFYPFKEKDGALTNIPGLCLLVMSADCLSIFFQVRDWVGVVHAGWKGTKEKIAQEALQEIGRRAGVDPSVVHIIFGPCIGRDAYEVGNEFALKFPDSSLKRVNGKLHFDLAAENKRQLIEAGAAEKNIHLENICTVTQNKDFYSFRNEGSSAGRIVSFIVKV